MNETAWTLGSVTMASPTSAPPMTTWRTPSGSPASRNTASITAPPQTGVWGSGLRMTALPNASAGPTTRIASTVGEFQGVMVPMTPIGTRRVIDSRPGITDGTSCPYGCDGSVAALCSSWTAKFCSWCIFPWIAPVSRWVHVPNSGRWAS